MAENSKLTTLASVYISLDFNGIMLIAAGVFIQVAAIAFLCKLESRVYVLGR